MTDQPHNFSGADDGSSRTPDIDYPGLVQESLRKVVRDVLAQVADLGLPGEHHFYVGFATGHPDVGVSDSLRAQFPGEMTVVLQHDYRDLEVDDDGFDVTLRFGGVPQRLRVPFAALTSFYDPAVQFMLRFDPDDVDLDADLDGAEVGAGADAESVAEADSEDAGERRTPTGVLREAGSFGPRAVTAEDGEDGEDGDRPAGEVVSIDAFRRK